MAAKSNNYMLDLTKRSLEPEILDDFELQGNDLNENLRELTLVNQFLGSYPLVKSGLRKLIATVEQEPVHIVDVGCGGGDVLRMLARWGRQNNHTLKLTGIDANEQAITYASQHSHEFPEISYRQLNIHDPAFLQLNADIFVFSLFMHHLPDDDIIKVLKQCGKMGAKILINDLHRHWIAYRSFSVFAGLFRFSYISRHDGKLSIKKGFIMSEWENLLKQANIDEFQLNWKWAFRHQIIIP